MKITELKINLFFFILLFMLSTSLLAEEKVRVTRVIDGDTIVLSDARRVRLIGIDTPEMKSSSKMRKDVKRTGRDENTLKVLAVKSKEFLEKLVLDKDVYLVFDIHNSANDNKDFFGRTLAYVKVYMKKPLPEMAEILKKRKQKWKRDEYMVNALMIQYGYAYAYTKYMFKWKDRFKDYEREARDMEYGLWGNIEGLEQAYQDDKSKGYFPFIASTKEAVVHKRDCPDAQHIFPKNILCFSSLDDAYDEAFTACEKCIVKESK